ncbi:MAG: hypothetical protein H7Z16_17440 [Pyrinomonadaceae bacterium]|nr:hypothetical protein [Pyrinomonadaceae bacterium]
MSVSFKYAMVEISGKPVLVDQKKIGEAAKALRDALTKIEGLTNEVLQKGFALQTPEGMKPVNLGSANDFSAWVAGTMKSTFDLTESIGKLPEPFKTGLGTLAATDIVIYSAVLFYTGDTGTGPAAAMKNKLYGELVIGFQVPDTFMKDFPVALREIVIAVNNYPVAAAADDADDADAAAAIPAAT